MSTTARSSEPADLNESRHRVVEASSKIKDGMQDIVKETKQVASMGQEMARESLENGVHAAKEKSHELAIALEQTVREKPFRALAIAAGAGLILGGLLRRGRS